MSPTTAGLPGFWRFVWLFWMQPITLHRLLRGVGLNPMESGWKLLRRTRSPQEAWWLLRSAQMILILSPGTTGAVAALVAALGQHVNWLGVACGWAVGWAVGLAFEAVLVLAVAGSVVGSVSIGLAVGVVGRMVVGTFGTTPGVVSKAAFVMTVVGAVVFNLVYIAGPVALEVARGVSPSDDIVGNRFVAFFEGLFRIPFLLIETIVETTAHYWNASTGRRTLRWAPVLYHERGYLPHPFLARHILAEADADPGLTRRVLEACSISPGQRRTGRKVEAKLRARELKRLAEAKDFLAIQELRGVWLPGIQGADPVLLAFSETARYLVAAQAVFNPHHRLMHLKGFSEQANALENQLRSQRDVFTQPEEPLRALRGRRPADARNAKGRGRAHPEPLRAGDPPRTPEGPELFRGVAKPRCARYRRDSPTQPAAPPCNCSHPGGREDVAPQDAAAPAA